MYKFPCSCFWVMVLLKYQLPIPFYEIMLAISWKCFNQNYLHSPTHFVLCDQTRAHHFVMYFIFEIELANSQFWRVLCDLPSTDSSVSQLWLCGLIYLILMLLLFNDLCTYFAIIDETTNRNERLNSNFIWHLFVCHFIGHLHRNTIHCYFHFQKHKFKSIFAEFHWYRTVFRCIGHI